MNEEEAKEWRESMIAARDLGDRIFCDLSEAELHEFEEWTKSCLGDEFLGILIDHIEACTSDMCVHPQDSQPEQCKACSTSLFSLIQRVIAGDLYALFLNQKEREKAKETFHGLFGFENGQEPTR